MVFKLWNQLKDKKATYIKTATKAEFFKDPQTSWHLVVQNQQWKHQSNWRNLVKVNDVMLVSLSLTLNRFHTLFWCFSVDFEQVNGGWRSFELTPVGPSSPSYSCFTVFLFLFCLTLHLMEISCWKVYLKKEILRNRKMSFNG